MNRDENRLERHQALTKLRNEIFFFLDTFLEGPLFCCGTADGMCGVGKKKQDGVDSF